MAAALRSASTVLVLAPIAAAAAAAKIGGYEIFLLKRSQKMSFMPNTVVFPGGACDDSDFGDGYLSLLQNAKATGSSSSSSSQTGSAWLSGLAAGDARTEVGRRIAALREVFEETGMLLVEEEERVSAQLSAEAREQWRKDVHADAGKFLQLLEGLHATPAVRSLIKYAHWITPVVEKKRFDTHFYVAILPPGSATASHAAHDIIESQGSAWATPAAALAAWSAKKIILAPPTWHSLQDLALHCPSTDAVRTHLRHKRIVPTMPHFVGFVEEESAAVLALPFDECHPGEGGGVSGNRHRILMTTLPGQLFQAGNNNNNNNNNSSSNSDNNSDGNNSDKKKKKMTNGSKNSSSTTPAAESSNRSEDKRPQYILQCNLPAATFLDNSKM